MTALSEIKSHASRLHGRGEPLHALRLYDAVLAAAPLDYEARLKVGDCLVALGENAVAAEVFRAVGRYALEAGHPLVAVVAARVIESLGGEFDDLLASLVVRYGSESELVGTFAARINLPAPDTEIAAPNLHAPAPPDLVQRAALRARTCTDGFAEFPAAVHPIPLLSSLSEAAFRRVLGTLVVRRLPDKELVIREGEPGQSFFFVATGQVRVYRHRAVGAAEGPGPAARELDRRRDGAASARGRAAPRSRWWARPTCSRSPASRWPPWPVSSSRSRWR